MISQNKQKGFTIVELLIVIVVIGILAAISIVAYTTITARANAATAASTAKSIKDVAENYKGANGSYPTTYANFTSGGTEAIAKLPTDIKFVNTISASSKTKEAKVTSYTKNSVISGFVICTYDYNNAEPASDEVCVTTGETTGSGVTPGAAILTP